MHRTSLLIFGSALSPDDSGQVNCFCIDLFLKISWVNKDTCIHFEKEIIYGQKPFEQREGYNFVKVLSVSSVCSVCSSPGQHLQTEPGSKEFKRSILWYLTHIFFSVVFLIFVNLKSEQVLLLLEKTRFLVRACGTLWAPLSPALASAYVRKSWLSLNSIEALH